MYCYRCGKKMPEDAVFCGYCGIRLDGKKACPSCGKLVEQDFSFCCYCGSLMEDGVGAAPGQPPVAEPVAEQKKIEIPPEPVAEQEDESAPSAESAEESVSKRNGRSVSTKRLAQISGIVMMVGALLSLVFVFLTGIRGRVLGLEENRSIFYFLGEFYREFSSGAAASPDRFASWSRTNELIVGILSTVIAVGGLASVVTLFVIAAVRYARSLVGKAKKSAAPIAYAAMACYLASVIAFGALHALTLEPELVSLGITLNGASIAGIVLVAAFAASSFVCNVIAHRHTVFQRDNLWTLVCAGLGLAFAVTVAALSGVAGMGSTEPSGGVSVEMHMSYPNAISTMINTVSSRLEGAIVSEHLSVHIVSATSMGAIAQICSVLLTVMAFCSVLAYGSAIRNGRKYRPLAFAIASVLLACGALTCGILAADRMARVYELADMQMIFRLYGNGICGVVFSALSLVAAILLAIKGKKVLPAAKPRDAEEKVRVEYSKLRILSCLLAFGAAVGATVATGQISFLDHSIDTTHHVFVYAVAKIKQFSSAVSSSVSPWYELIKSNIIIEEDVLLCLIALAGVVVMLTLLVLTLVRTVRLLRSRKTRSPELLAMGSGVAYCATIALLATTGNATVVRSEAFRSFTEGVSLAPNNWIGVGCVLAVLAASLTCYVVEHRGQIFAKERTASSVIALVATVLGVVTVVMSAGISANLVHVRTEDSLSYRAGWLTAITFGVNHLEHAFLYVDTAAAYQEATATLAMTSVYLMVGQALLVLAVVASVLAAIYQFRRLKHRTNGDLVWSIAATVLIAAASVCATIARRFFFSLSYDYTPDPAIFEWNGYGTMIAVIVSCVAMLFATVLGRVLEGVRRRAEKSKQDATEDRHAEAEDLTEGKVEAKTEGLTENPTEEVQGTA